MPTHDDRLREVEALYRSFVFAGEKLTLLRAAFVKDIEDAKRRPMNRWRDASIAFNENRIRIIDKILAERACGS